MSILPFQRSARDEDIRACRSFIRGIHHPAAAFVCIGDRGEIEASGVHNMSALQLLALASAVLRAVKIVAAECPCDASHKIERVADKALAALWPLPTKGDVH